MKNKKLPSELQLDSLPVATKKAFLSLSVFPLCKKSGWYLAGGTGLAIQTGHRQSVDLDFFTKQKKINELQLLKELSATGQWQTTWQAKGTIYGIFGKAKVSFITYPFFTPSRKKLTYGNIQILLPQDIAIMKIIAISQRGKKRDFYDLYWYCKNVEPLTSIISRVAKQYPGQEKNLNHILKSLSYFVDADSEPTPKIFFRVTWSEIKKFFTSEAKKAIKELIFQ